MEVEREDGKKGRKKKNKRSWRLKRHKLPDSERVV